MIHAMRAEHAASVARLHCEALTGLLQQLGEPAAAAYYGGAVRSDMTVAYVDVESGVTRGFVLGSSHPDQLKARILRANPIGVIATTGYGVIRHPASFAWLVRSFRGPDEGTYDARVPELTYLATHANHRGAGIGRALVAAFEKGLSARGESLYELSVDDTNREACAFYEKLGMIVVGTYREFGIVHRRYRKQIASAPQSAPTPRL